MAKDVPLGVRHEVEHRVEFDDTLQKHHPKLPPVLSTPEMIRLMETACFRALMPFHEGDEVNVGTAIHVEHRAATGIGALVKVEAVLQSVRGRFYTFHVRAWDEKKEIGRGTVDRAFVRVGTFMGKVNS